MRNIKLATIMIATFSTIFLMSGSSVPEANAGIGLTMTFGGFCILTINSGAAPFGTVTPPANGTANFNFQNDGTGTQVISADVGDSTNGGMQESGSIMILPINIHVNATTAFDLEGEQTMSSTGALTKIADLEPFTSANENNNARPGTITAETDNLQKSATAGAALTGTLTLTGGTCS